MRSRTRDSVRPLGAAIALLLAAPLAGCAPVFFTEGEELARRGAETVATQIGAHRDSTAGVTIEEMVAWWVPAGDVSAGPGRATVEALAWSDRIGQEREATIDVRIHVQVDAHSASTIGGRSNSAGEATVCYRLAWPPYGEASSSEIACPETAVPLRPEPPARPELTDEDTALISDILATTGGLEAIESALRDAFPEEYIRIDTDLWNGETVVAVGIPAERECILVVRDEAGVLSFPSYRPISLAPGEAGCVTELYTDPPF